MTTGEDNPTAPRTTTSSEVPSGFITRDGQGRLVFDAEGAAPGSDSTFPSLSANAPSASLWRAVSCGVVIHGADGAIADANDAATRLFGRPLAELCGLHLGVAPLDCVDEHGTKIEPKSCFIARAIVTGEVQMHATVGIRLPEGDRRWLHADAAPVFGADGRIAHVVTTFVDITSRVELLEAQRLAFLATLGAALSHEMNNPLAYLLANLEFLSQEVAATDGSEVRAALDEARVGVHRMATIVKELNALVTVKFPPAPPVPSSASVPQTNPTRLRLFVIDDEAVLTRALHRAIGRDHEVVVSNDSMEAADSLLSSGFLDGFDVVLCDVTMPGLTGIEVYERVASKYPEQAKKFVFMSGGAFTKQAREFLAQAQVPRLDKPFEMAELRALLSARFGPR